MSGPIARFLAADHDRLDQLLAQATATPETIERESYEAFRAGLLRHIGIEEKILVTAFRKAGPPDPGFDALARRLRIDHGAIAALLVPSPSHALVRELRSILAPHNAVEEGEAGFYARCDARLAAEADALVTRMQAYPQVPTMPHNDGPRVHRTAAEALAVSARQFDRR
ncbi:MAG: hemerythrin domain-containing protein [Anaeromyxobacteraceae bacterium]